MEKFRSKASIDNIKRDYEKFEEDFQEFKREFAKLAGQIG